MATSLDNWQECVEERFSKVGEEHGVTLELKEFVLSLEDEFQGGFFEMGRPVEKSENFKRLSFPAVDPVSLLRTEVQLPSLPQLYLELQEVINDPDSSASDVAAVISKDPSLAAYVLRMVNSSFYSFPSQVETISRAVSIIGTKQLAMLVTGTSMLDAFKEVMPPCLDMVRFWKHSIGCGTIALILGKHMRTKDAERFFVAGLLHDIGRLTLFKTLPLQAAYSMRLVVEENMFLHQAENEVFGFDHTKLGSILLRKWNFPHPLVMAVLLHHSPEKVLKNQDAAVVCVADSMTKALGMGCSGEYYVEPISDQLWEAVGVKPGDISEIGCKALEALEETYRVIMNE